MGRERRAERRERRRYEREARQRDLRQRAARRFAMDAIAATAFTNHGGMDVFYGVLSGLSLSARTISLSNGITSRGLLGGLLLWEWIPLVARPFRKLPPI